MSTAVDQIKTGIGPGAILLGASAVGASITGTLTETALATVSIPAGCMKTDGGLLVISAWSYTNSANTKTLRERLGGIAGAALLGVGPTTTLIYTDERRVRNRGSAASQVVSCGISAPGGGFGSGTSALPTLTVDTTVAQDLVLSGQLTNTGETITLELYEVWLLP